MGTHLSVSEIFRKLEERMKPPEERAAFHSRQESHHREQSAFHTAELQKVGSTSRPSRPRLSPQRTWPGLKDTLLYTSRLCAGRFNQFP